MKWLALILAAVPGRRRMGRRGRGRGIDFGARIQVGQVNSTQGEENSGPTMGTNGMHKIPL